jgi:predicted flavoprotein YhiN
MAIKADIIIIGGGAAGLMAAAGAARTLGEGKVIVLEKMARPGRKIMITGKGRCNFTNLKQWNEFQQHVHPKPGFLKSAFYNLSAEKMLDFMEDNSMAYVVERGDRAFPESHLASDVVDALVRAAQTAGAEILCGKEVKSISYLESPDSAGSDDGTSAKQFELKCADGSQYICSKLIICTGGLSYPKTGSTGDGYRWAEETGHKIRPLFPSLTAIVPRAYKDLSPAYKPADEQKKIKKSAEDISESNTSSTKLKGHIDRSTPFAELGEALSGNQLKNVGLSLFIDGNEAQYEFGDLDFTDGGIEGPIGFKISRRCVNAIINGSKVYVVLDLKPAVEPEDLTVRISTLWNEVMKDKRSANKQYKERFRILLTKVMPMSLIPGFVKMNPNVDHKTLAKALKNWKIDIEGFVGYERCVITAGGVSLDDITPKTLESRIVPGLHFAGEVLDLDADTGGYNLQTAFSTGYLAGICAAKTL